MFTDMVGYTALGQRNESLSLALVEEQRKLIRPILGRYNGREIKTMGDAFLVEFPSALDAVRCAYDIQRTTREFNVPFPSDRRIHLRIGVHLGDVIESQGDISGDAVNVASRIEPLAEDGGVCVTRPVYESMHNKFDTPFASIGTKSLKNVSEPMEVYKMTMPWEQPTRADASSYPTNRVAILPFISFSSNPDDAYFSDGITEEIISTVSGIGGLGVISRTSVMRYKGTNKTIEEIGKELRVGSVLEGSFRKAGNRIRVTAQLINVADDQHMWAQNYDRNLDDVFEVQSDIAKQVADALKVRILSPEKERIEKKPTESTAAYTLYLKGRQLWRTRLLEDLKKAMEYFEQAVKEDPGYALGYAGLADCFYLLRDNWGFDIVENLKKAKEMAAKALELDPGLAEAHTTKASVLVDECNLSEAEEEYRKAIELKPNYATAHQWYSNMLRSQQRWDEALEEVEKALELDPLSPIINVTYAFWYDDRREYKRAIEIYKRVLELEPGYGIHHFTMWTYGRMGMFDDMRREASLTAKEFQGFESTTRLWADYCVAYCEDNKRALRALLPELEARSTEPWIGAYMVATCYFKVGEKDKGFEWLERVYSQRRESLLPIKVDPFFDEIRTDPRYVDLVRRLALD
jgi:adenylate cyclase